MQNLYLSKANILLPIIDQIVFNFCSSIIIFKQSFFLENKPWNLDNYNMVVTTKISKIEKMFL